MVWNPALFVPFIAVPLVNMVVSYAAMAAGLVPPVVVDVSWTTPPLVGGWVATGSPAGAVLQLACIALGTVLYLPFLRRYERLADAHARVQYDALLSSFQDDERAGRSVELVTAAGSLGAVARSLAEDVRAAVDAGAFELRYQPQFDADGRAVGAEALLRMEHPVYGWLYPPLVIELAREAGAGGELERAGSTPAAWWWKPPSARRCCGTRARTTCCAALRTRACRWPSMTSPWAAPRSST